MKKECFIILASYSLESGVQMPISTYSAPGPRCYFRSECCMKLSLTIKSYPKYSKPWTERLLWLTHVCQVACSFGRALKDWKARVLIPMHKGDRRQNASITWTSSVVQVPWTRHRKTIGPKLENTHCDFRPGIIVQIFTLQQFLEITGECSKDVYTCFANFKKAHHWVFWKRFLECCRSRVVSQARFFRSGSNVSLSMFWANFRPA